MSISTFYARFLLCINAKFRGENWLRSYRGGIYFVKSRSLANTQDYWKENCYIKIILFTCISSLSARALGLSLLLTVAYRQLLAVQIQGFSEEDICMGRGRVNYKLPTGDGSHLSEKKCLLLLKWIEVFVKKQCSEGQNHDPNNEEKQKLSINKLFTAEIESEMENESTFLIYFFFLLKKKISLYFIFILKAIFQDLHGHY